MFLFKMSIFDHGSIWLWRKMGENKIKILKFILAKWKNYSMKNLWKTVKSKGSIRSIKSIESKGSN